VASARPREPHPFPPLQGRAHTAVSTPGDLLFHIRADRHDLVFELERQLLDLLVDAVAVAVETVGFRYFDARDLLGSGHRLHEAAGGADKRLPLRRRAVRQRDVE
jgi:putative iron-dependent peroxidase